MDGGVNNAVAPEGKPLTLKSTSSAKPLMTVIVVVKFVAVPARIVCVSGAAAIPKSVTISVTVMPLVNVPLMPLIVSGYDPGGVANAVPMLNVVSPEPVIEVGRKLATA